MNCLPFSVFHSSYIVHESQAIFGSLIITLSRRVDSLPQGKEPSGFTNLSWGNKLVNTLSSIVYPSLTVQLPVGDGWTIIIVIIKSNSNTYFKCYQI